MTTETKTRIHVMLDGIHAGSGYLRDGIVEDCGAQFCDDNDESMEVYEQIEAAIADGDDEITVELVGKDRVISWYTTEE